MSEFDPDGPDFSGGGGSFHIPEGEYAMECVSIENGESKSSGEPMYTWQFKGTEGKAKGKTFYLHTRHDDVQRLGHTALAVGLEVEDKMDEITQDQVEGVEVIGVVEDDEYNGQKRSKLTKVMSTEEAEPEPETRRGRSRRGKDNGAEERGSRSSRRAKKVSEDDVKEMDESELEDLVGKHELEVDLDKLKTMSRKRNAVIEALGEAELLA